MTSASVIFDVIGRDRASGTFDKVGNSADRSGSKMAKFGKIAKFAALGLAAGAGAAAVGLFKLAKGAAEDEAGQVRLARAVRNNANATRAQTSALEDWISKQGVAYGVADDQLRPALENLVVATKDVGKAQKLATLAMDISAAKGMSLESVSKMLAKAQNGNVNALAKLGIKTKESVKDEAAWQAASIASTKARDKYNKAVAEFGPKSKEAALAADELEYRQTRLGQTQGKVKNSTIDFAEAQERLAKAYGGAAADNANTLEGKMSRLKLILSETGETIGSKLIPVASDLAGWFLNKGLPAMSRFGDYLGQKLPPIFDRVKAVVGVFRGDVSSNLDGVKNTFADAVSIIRSLWGAFGNDIVRYLRATFTNVRIILKGAFTIVRGIFKTVSALLRGDWKGVWDGIKLILKGAVTLVIGIIRQAWNVMRLAFKVGGTALKAVFRAAWDGLKSLAASGAIALVNGIKSIPGKILGLHKTFASAGKSLLQAFLDGMKNAGGLIAGIAGNVWNAVRGLLNKAIDKINAALVFKVPIPGPGPDISIDAPNIPHLAKGGIVTRPTVALIGEAGPEAVVPLGRRGALGGGGDLHVHVHMNGFAVGDPTQFTRQMEKAMIEGARNMGRALQIPVAP